MERTDSGPLAECSVSHTEIQQREAVSGLTVEQAGPCRPAQVENSRTVTVDRAVAGMVEMAVVGK